MGQSAFIRVVGDEDIALPDRIVPAVHFEDATYQVTIDRCVEEHRRCNDQPPIAVKDHATEVARLADDGRIARAVEMIMHLIDQAGDLVAQSLGGDGVHVTPSAGSDRGSQQPVRSNRGETRYWVEVVP